MTFLISLQDLFMSSFLFSVKVSVLFIFLSLAVTFFHSSDMVALALKTGTPSNSFLIFRMSLQNRLYAIFLDGTSNLGVFKGFTLKTFLLTEVVFILFSFSKSSERIRKILVHVYPWHFLSMKILNLHRWNGHKFSHDHIKVMKILFLLIMEDGRHPHDIQPFSY